MTRLAEGHQATAIAVPEPAADAWQLSVLLDSECTNTPDENVLSESLVHQWCVAALQSQKLLDLNGAGILELSVQLLGRPAMQVLNRHYRGKDAPTNVLSFAADMPLMGTEHASSLQIQSSEQTSYTAAQLLLLGDLVLCPAVIEAEAHEQGKPLAHHWAHMVVHGTLHLCGHDHESAVDANAMESLEIQILSSLGLPDPYRKL